MSDEKSPAEMSDMELVEYVLEIRGSVPSEWARRLAKALKAPTTARELTTEEWELVTERRERKKRMAEILDRERQHHIPACAIHFGGGCATTEECAEWTAEHALTEPASEKEKKG